MEREKRGGGLAAVFPNALRRHRPSVLLAPVLVAFVSRLEVFSRKREVGYRNRNK